MDSLLQEYLSIEHVHQELSLHPFDVTSTVIMIKLSKPSIISHIE